jgi:hypothetical protein
MYNNKYRINVLHGAFSGVQFGFGVVYGNISSNCDQFEICKEKDKADYTTISNWMSNLKNED